MCIRLQAVEPARGAGLAATASVPNCRGGPGSGRARKRSAGGGPWPGTSHAAPAAWSPSPLQYGHLRTALGTEVSEEYASRSRGGIHRLLDVETALAVAETAADLREHFQAGGGVSGPAARLALLQAANTPRFEGREVKPDFARKFLARDGAGLYDNPHALLLCLYKRDRALCAKGETSHSPTLDRCVPGCGNIVRTDHHAAQLRARADILDSKATHTPQPVGDRLRATAARLRSYADNHDRTRITRQKSPA